MDMELDYTDGRNDDEDDDEDTSADSNDSGDDNSDNLEDSDDSSSDQDSSDNSDSDDSSSGDSDSSDTTATDDEVANHKAALGSLIDNLKGRGIDVAALAQDAGVGTDDVDALEHDDALTLAKHIANEHPEITQSIFSRFPVAQGLLGRFLGN